MPACDLMALQAARSLAAGLTDPWALETLTSDITLGEEYCHRYLRPGTTERFVTVPRGLDPGTMVSFYRPYLDAPLRVIWDIADSSPVVLQTVGGGGGGANTLERGGYGIVMIDDDGNAILSGNWVAGDYTAYGNVLADLQPKASLQTEAAAAVSAWNSGPNGQDNFTQGTTNNQPTVDLADDENNRAVKFTWSSGSQFMTNARTTVVGNGFLAALSLRSYNVDSSGDVTMFYINTGSHGIDFYMRPDTFVDIRRRAGGGWSNIVTDIQFTGVEEPIMVLVADHLNGVGYWRTNVRHADDRLGKNTMSMPDLTSGDLGDYRIGMSSTRDAADFTLYGLLTLDNIPTDYRLADMMERALGWAVAQQDVGAGVIE